MITNPSLTAGIFCLLTCVRLHAADTNGTITDHPDTAPGFSATYGHSVFVPDGYDASNRLYPLIVVFGGVGERGNGDSELNRLRAQGPLQLIDRGEDNRAFFSTTNPCIIMQWQIPSTSVYNIGDTEGMISYAIANYRVDPRQIHLTGLSLGGGHVWKYAAAMPDRLASIMPICGSSTPSAGEGLSLAGLPIWAHHNALDNVVSLTNTSFLWCGQAAQGRGGVAETTVAVSFPYTLANYSGQPNFTGHYNPTGGWSWWAGVGSDFAGDNPLLTVYATNGHGGWTSAYGNFATYDWMFAHPRSEDVLVIDNRSIGQVRSTGPWMRTSSIPGFYGSDFSNISANNSGAMFTFAPVLPQAGTYEVQMRWPSAAHLTTQLPVTVVHDGVHSALTVDQTTNGKSWRTLGTWAFSGTTGAEVRLDARNLSASAVADAVRFRRVGTNAAPTVSTAATLTVIMPAAVMLIGTASDDGQPGPLSTAWTQLQGPGTTLFSTPGMLNTSASFSQSGTYVLRVTVSDGQLSAAAEVMVTVSPAQPASGSITHEWWSNVPGNWVSNIPLGTTPTGSSTLSSFETPTNRGNNYGQRVRGYVIPPVSGNYVLWISSDDHSELWLSTDANMGNRRKIAGVTGWTPSRSWKIYASQKSVAINLTAGATYYIEALHKEGAAGDSLAVAWSLPGQSTSDPTEIIPGASLLPFSEPVGLTREYWLDLKNVSSVSGIPRDQLPAGTELLATFEAPGNWANYYGQVLSGYLIPPASGDYTFWIASDDSGELWLSPSQDPAGKVRIASVTGYTLTRQWDKYASQRSVVVPLQAGQRYYIEALHVEIGGNDCLGVGWAKPGESTAAPSQIIPGSALRSSAPNGSG